MKKQMAYADANRIDYVVIAGETEIQSNQLSVKNMNTGEQISVEKEKLCKIVSL
jgi:histidyl-tRNA synthetase